MQNPAENRGGGAVLPTQGSEDLPLGPNLQMTTDTGIKESQLKPLLVRDHCQLAVCRGIGGQMKPNTAEFTYRYSCIRYS